MTLTLSPTLRSALRVCWTVLWWYLALCALWLMLRVLA